MAEEILNKEIVDNDYDEEEDSDFDQQEEDEGSISSSTDDETVPNKAAIRNKKSISSRPVIEELDSGDEVTIKERQKSTKRSKKQKKDGQLSSDDDGNREWRAKTRSMRVQEQTARQKKTLVSIKSSTVDVNMIWEEMNKPGPLPPIYIEGQTRETSVDELRPALEEAQQDVDLGKTPAEEMITIKWQYQFAGETHREEKVVPKSSAEAKLWLAGQENKKTTSAERASNKQRPLRKISKFDPNYANLEAFRNQSIKAQPEEFSGPKLNVVEKSKMDWVAHVDQAGLRDELDVHAKGKGAYQSRMEFLNQVGQRQDDEARAARQKG